MSYSIAKEVRSISRIAAIIIVVVIIVVAAAGYAALAISHTTSNSTNLTSSSQSSLTSSSSSRTGSAPQTFTWETASTIEDMDPGYSYGLFDFQVMQNVYEPLFYYNGSSSTQVIPWLAQSYTQSPDLKTYNFTLRTGIKFADGEPFNSTAVYFSLNRLLVADGSSQDAHGIRAAWIVQQLLNTSLSTQLCTCNQVYNKNYVNAVLAQNFVQITGPYSFTIHVVHPNTAFQFLLAGEWADMLAPDYVMQHDLALWTQSSQAYSLPYPTLGGNTTSIINEYLDDIAATCNAGVTPNGCGTPYLDGSYQGSLAGTGPYTIASIGQTSNNIVLQANQNYWGGPNQYSGGSKIVPQFQTIDINYVPQTSTRELDLHNAAASGDAMSVDIPNSNLFDIADRNSWTNNGTLSSIIPGVTIYGPEVAYTDIFDAFSTNVTNYFTHSYNSFQPFADQRFRLAFADAINTSAFNIDVNNRLGQVEINAIPPGLPPQGSYNASVTPKYSFNPDQSAQLLLDAMKSPLTKFNFRNGTAAPSGLFNNAFGCTSLNSNGQCSNPVSQNIQLLYPTGWYDQNSLVQMAQVINNISATYNMGLTVSVSPMPFGQMFAQVDTGSVYMFSTGWFDDYPWVTDFLGPIYFSGGNWPSETNWNLTAMNTLYSEAINASESGNLNQLVSINNQMNTLANSIVMYVWMFYPDTFTVITSNVQGYVYNPSVVGFYFATMS